MKRSIKSARQYKDSQAKLIIARKRYRDALRRYRDAEGEERVSKFKALKDKINEKLAMFVKDHPDMIKYAKKISIISAKALSIMMGIATGGLVALNVKAISDLKKAGFQLKEMSSLLPAGIGVLLTALSSVLFGFAAWAAKRSEEDLNRR